jgi:hypothetical protein
MSLVSKMATPQQRSWCVLQLWKKEFIAPVQREFRIQFHMEPSSRIHLRLVQESDVCGLLWKKVRKRPTFVSHTQRADQHSCLCKCPLSAQTSGTRVLGSVVPCEIVCEIHVAHLLQTLSSPTAEHINRSVAG